MRARGTRRGAAVSSPRLVAVTCGAQDVQVLADCAGEAEAAVLPGQYSDRIILKPWGYEYLLFRTDAAAGWVLFIQAGHATSMHCHRRKSTSLAVLDGVVRCTTLTSSRLRNTGDVFQVGPGAFHQTSALSAHGAFVLEIETPDDKHDLVRHADAYGRTGKAYESHDMHVASLRDQTTLRLPRAPGEHSSRTLGASIVTLVHPEGVGRDADDAIVCVVQGGAVDGNGRPVGPGDCLELATWRHVQWQCRAETLVAVITPRPAHRSLPALSRMSMDA
jgi:quercetin dioxygenase-like cupin family protein